MITMLKTFGLAVMMMSAEIWTPVFPSIPESAMVYSGRYGKHASYRGDDEAPDIRGALAVCKDKKWSGYVRWRSNDGLLNVDACRFLRLIKR